jgi:hypothetical protein
MGTMRTRILETILFAFFLCSSSLPQTMAGSVAGRRALTPQPLPADLQLISYDNAKLVNLWWSSQFYGTQPPLPPGATPSPELSLYYSPSLNAVFLGDQTFDYIALETELSAMRAMTEMDSSDPGGPTGFSTNDLWAEGMVVTNDAAFSTANLIIHPPESEMDSVFDVFYTPSLQEPLQWYWVYRTLPWETNIWATGLGLSSGFFKIADTNGPMDPSGLTAACMSLAGTAALTNDLDADGLPDAWEIKWFGGLSQPGSLENLTASTVLSFGPRALCFIPEGCLRIAQRFSVGSG